MGKTQLWGLKKKSILKKLFKTWSFDCVEIEWGIEQICLSHLCTDVLPFCSYRGTAANQFKIVLVF